jgi:protein SCO1/2
LTLHRSPYFWAFLSGIVALALIRPLLRHEPPPPPVLGELPAFSLTDPTGRPFGSADLAGQVWIANFFFTRCPSICPKLMDAAARLDRRLDEAGVEGVRLVSITVDPEWDTPERLRHYAAARRIDPARWTLLTGDAAAIHALVYGGFKTALGPPETDPGGVIDIAHSGKLVLVDWAGRVRGYYDTDELGLDETFHRARHVLAESEEER